MGCPQATWFTPNLAPDMTIQLSCHHFGFTEQSKLHCRSGGRKTSWSNLVGLLWPGLSTTMINCKCATTFRAGHEMEIVCLAFNPPSTLIATGSMDHTGKGTPVMLASGHAVKDHSWDRTACASCKVCFLSCSTLRRSQMVTSRFHSHFPGKLPMNLVYVLQLWDVETGQERAPPGRPHC